MVKVYSRIKWVNKKDGQTTPLGATNLNRMDAAIDEMDNNIVELDTLKADKETVNTMLADCEYDEKTGIVKLTRKNGEQIVFDLNIEKIPVAFELSPSGVLTMTTDDGTEWTADIASMIPVLTFNNSDTINVIVKGTGNNKTYTFEVKDGSITGDKLQPNYLADIKVESLNASASADRAYESEQNAAESARSIQDIAEQILKKTPINNLLATVAGSPLDAVQGKVLDDKITALNSNLNNAIKKALIGSAGNYDANNYTDEGRYSVSAVEIWENLPDLGESTSHYGVLLVFNASYYIAQCFIHISKVYFRIIIPKENKYTPWITFSPDN